MSSSIRIDPDSRIGIISNELTHPEGGEYDTSHFLLLTLSEKIRKHGNDVEIAHTSTQIGVESQHPKTERALILHLEIHVA